MKIGEEIRVLNVDLLVPLIGKVLTLEVDGEAVTARISMVTSSWSTIKIVPPDTKE